MLPFYIITAVTLPTWGIGYQGYLPWTRVQEDLTYFKQKTSHSFIIMGRKTWDSFQGKMLPNRIHVVLTRSNYKEDKDNLHFVSSFVDAMEWIEKYTKEEKNVFVIGGESIYREAIVCHSEFCKAIYITNIIALSFIPSDAYFPRKDMIQAGFRPIKGEEEKDGDEKIVHACKNVPYCYYQFTTWGKERVVNSEYTKERK